MHIQTKILDFIQAKSEQRTHVFTQIVWLGNQENVGLPTCEV